MSFYHDDPLVSAEAFHELIRERAEARRIQAQEKCAEGRRQIADRKSSEGVYHPMDLFPEEIWVELLTLLNPEDRGNMWQIHSWFQSLMESHRNRDILLPQAIKFLLDYVKNNDMPTFQRKDISTSKLAPYMKLREICKSLRLGVDRWFEEKILEELHQHQSPPIWNSVPGMTFHLCRDKDRLKSLCEFQKGGKKAFFVRSIDVVLSTAYFRPSMDALLKNPHDGYQILFHDTYSDFRTALIELLELIGDQIWNFHFRVEATDLLANLQLNFAEHYTFLLKSCELMPNLKRLGIDFRMNGYVEMNGMPPNLRTLIETCTFPTLNNLERISMEQGRLIEVTPIIYDAILRANPQVKMLRFEMDYEVLELIPRNTLEALLELENFSWRNLTPLSNHTCINFTPPKNWPLKYLEMHSQLPTLKELVQLLENFPTLEKLELDLFCVKIGNGAGFLNLPNLTHLKISFCGEIDFERDDLNFFFSLQFLLHAKKLKRLEWSHDARLRSLTREELLESLMRSSSMRHHGRREQTLPEYLVSHERSETMIDFRGGMRDMTSCNVWKVFPELEEVKVAIVSTRGRNEEIKRHHRP